MIQKTLKPLSILILAGVGLWLAPSALAENSLKANEAALSFSVANESFTLGGRYLVSPDLAVLGQFGFKSVDLDNGADRSGTSFEVGAGIRKYLSTQSELAPFIGAGIAFFSEYDPGKDDNTRGIGLDAHFGAEYFLGKRFSTEAAVGVRFETKSNDTDETTFGTVNSAVGVNFYFP